LIKVNSVLTIDANFNIIHKDNGTIGKIIFNDKELKLYFIRHTSNKNIAGPHLMKIINTLSTYGYTNTKTKEYRKNNSQEVKIKGVPVKTKETDASLSSIYTKISELSVLLEEKEKARVESFTKLIDVLVKELSEVKQAVKGFNDLNEVSDLINKIGNWDDKSRNLMLNVLELKKNVA
jgi:O-phosphoseryl-tRNA(Cys) synthetase